MNARGFALPELMVVAAIAGVLAVLAAPTLVSYARASTLQAGARELATVINLGRQIAITQNTAVCVEVAGTNVRLRTGGGGGAGGAAAPAARGGAVAPSRTRAPPAPPR